jgi:type IV pilus assembly protein PilP
MKTLISYRWLPVFGVVALNGAAYVAAETTVTIEKKKNDAFYSPFGKRDPFRVPTVGGLGEDSSVGPLQRFHVDQFRLRAILRGIGEAKAMFQDPKGRSHIVRQGDVIGIERATVSRIIKSEVILTERTYNYLGKESLLEKVIALPQDTELDPLQLVNMDAVAPTNEPDPNMERNFEALEEWTGDTKRAEPAVVKSDNAPRTPATPATSATPTESEGQPFLSAPVSPSATPPSTPPATSPVLGVNDPAARPAEAAKPKAAAPGFEPIPGLGTPGNAASPVDAQNSVGTANTPLAPQPPVTQPAQ